MIKNHFVHFLIIYIINTILCYDKFFDIIFIIYMYKYQIKGKNKNIKNLKKIIMKVKANKYDKVRHLSAQFKRSFISFEINLIYCKFIKNKL